MSKSTTILNFFKRKNINNFEVIADDARLPTPSVDVPVSENLQTKVPNVIIDESTGFVRDPGMRKKIWEYDANERDEIRRAYIKLGPYQPKLDDYKKTKFGSHYHKFKHSWFAIKEFSTWLEYSPSKDDAFCLPCFLFDKPTGNSGSHVFIKDGFRNWKKFNDGNNCSYLNHMGKEPNSFHRASEQAMTDLMNQSQHIQNVLENFNSNQIASNRLRLKASIDVVKVLAFQGLAFRERDESSDSINRGNFLEILDLVVSYNEYVAEAIEKAPKNASYKSPKIQKEILDVFSNKVKKTIREEIGDANFCLIVDEARDESMKEQMTIIIRFVDKDDIQGQGYDGASNMRGEWNGLKALISNDCLCAYYIHCFAHRLQLALVAVSKEVILVQSFFNRLLSIVNVVGASCKRTEQLKKAYADQIAYFVEIGELETGRGLNQISTLQRAGETRWGSHLRSISSLCQSQDILNTMNFVSSTKALIQKFRDEEWDNLLTTVKSFCKAHDIDVPDMNTRYVERGGLAHYQQDDFTIEHHYQVDIFYATIDSILQELNHRFSKHAVELLNLSSALDPKEARESFRNIDILLLVSKFYPKDFTNQEMTLLKTEVDHYEHNVVRHPDFMKLSSISELCQWLVKTRKSLFYPYIYRLITLVLTLPVSTATTE
ncbi:uncharacterized protein LOC142612275 [Castanea sativa]|uniref:uncharacterized protein LOC142612275 n=1 Tax=Castanea sativa TaxID=21020 RepID=UPI003F6541DC